jgi:hypothetical protein
MDLKQYLGLDCHEWSIALASSALMAFAIWLSW